MIAALVQIQLPEPVSRDAARETFLSTAPKYREVKGLVRKHYILSQDGTTAGGVYIWNSYFKSEANSCIKPLMGAFPIPTALLVVAGL